MAAYLRSVAYIIALFLPLVLLMSSCRKDDPDYIAEKDRKRILEFLDEHEMEYTELEGGVFVVITHEGSGGHPNENSTVRMNYEGYLLDGSIFDYAYNEMIPLANMIRGFRIGVQAFQPGGKGTILIPSAMGYGEFPPFGNIPRNAVLLFDVEIIDF